MIEMLRDRPIRQKIVLISLAVAALALVLDDAGFIVNEFVTARREAVERMKTVSSIVSRNSAAALAFDNALDATANLEALRTEKQIETACFYRLDGTFFAGYTRDGASRPCPERPPEAQTDPLASGDIVTVTPVVLGSDEFGSLMVAANSLEVYSRVQRYMVISLFVMIASGAIAMLLASRLQRFISAPILNLVSAARRVSTEKNYATRARRFANDELGMLADAFNEMLEQIQHRDRQLEVHRDRLDEEVQARTKELEDVIDELQGEIAQRERAEERIRYLAYYDVLTGLPNRRLLKERLETAISENRRSENKRLALLFLDLDRFKEVNDSYGHATGDQLLEQVAERLVTCVRGTDQVARRDSDAHLGATVSRQGGDEFTILLTGLMSGHDASRVADRILKSLEDPIELPERDIVIGTSIGIAVYPDDGIDADTLIKHADTAMYHAKDRGRNDFEYFSESMKVAALSRLTLESDLRRAIDEEQFRLSYQPIFDIETGQIEEVEALLRWDHSMRGTVSPDQFIPAAEECGLIGAIGDWVIHEACRQAARWVDQGLVSIRVAVNVSSHQFRKSQLLDSVQSALEAANLEPHHLELEVTEGSMLDNEAAAIQILGELREMGVSIALDDFGTGYSSLSYLQRLPLSSLKIDRSFIARLEEDDDDGRAIVTAIITMAHTLGLTVVAEGVETERQKSILRGWGCDHGQGYLCSPGVFPEDIPELVRDANRVLREDEQGA